MESLIAKANETRNCGECLYLESKVSWWCVNKEAIKARNTAIPGVRDCNFWKIDMDYIKNIMKTQIPTRLEVLGHFKKAKKVKDLYSGKVIDIEKRFLDISSASATIFFDLKNEPVVLGKESTLTMSVWDVNDGYAKIMETTKNMIFRNFNYFLSYTIPKRTRKLLVNSLVIMVFTIVIHLLDFKFSFYNYTLFYLICMLFYSQVLSKIYQEE